MVSCAASLMCRLFVSDNETGNSLGRGEVRQDGRNDPRRESHDGVLRKLEEGQDPFHRGGLHELICDVSGVAEPRLIRSRLRACLTHLGKTDAV